MIAAMKRPRAILLDLDGTLIDSSEAIAEGILEVAGALGLRVPDRAWALGRIGSSPQETWSLLDAPDVDAAVARFRTTVLPRLPDRTRCLPGAREALAELSAEGYLLGVATTRATDSAREALRRTGLLAHVRAIGGGDLVNAHKPDPEVLHLVLGELGCAPDEALMVGDTTADVRAARAAGLPCWAVLGGTHDEKTLHEAGADLILARGIAELPAALAAHKPMRTDG
jgi:phosphoglycolate phosphatase